MGRGADNPLYGDRMPVVRIVPGTRRRSRPCHGMCDGYYHYEMFDGGPECCGRYLDTGECCGNPVPGGVEIEAIDSCPFSPPEPPEPDSSRLTGISSAAPPATSDVPF